MAAFVPVFFCSHSLMDRISDSGSDGLGSNPDGSTKNAFVGIYRPYRGKKTGKVLKKTLPFFYTVCQICMSVSTHYDRRSCPRPQRLLFRVSQTCSRGGPVRRRRRCGTSRGRMQRRPDMRQYSVAQCFRAE